MDATNNNQKQILVSRELLLSLALYAKQVGGTGRSDDEVEALDAARQAEDLLGEGRANSASPQREKKPRCWKCEKKIRSNTYFQNGDGTFHHVVCP